MGLIRNLREETLTLERGHIEVIDRAKLDLEKLLPGRIYLRFDVANATYFEYDRAVLLGLFIGVKRKVEMNGGDLVLVNVEPWLLSKLHITCLLRIFKVEQSEGNRDREHWQKIINNAGEYIRFDDSYLKPRELHGRLWVESLSRAVDEIGLQQSRKKEKDNCEKRKSNDLQQRNIKSIELSDPKLLSQRVGKNSDSEFSDRMAMAKFQLKWNGRTKTWERQ